MLRAEFRGSKRKKTKSFEAALDLHTSSLRDQDIIEKPAAGGGTGWRRKVGSCEAPLPTPDAAALG